MKYKLFSLLVITIVFYGCGGGSWDVYLCAQKIEGSSKVIYKYDAWGGRDSHKSRYAILDSSEIFDVNKIDELPILYFIKIPNKNLITGIEVAPPDSDKTLIYKPLKVYEINKQDIVIKINKYQYNGFAEKDLGLRGDYKFTRFRETKDSVFFFNLDNVEHQYVDSLKFRKTNITISQSKIKYITKIEVNDLIVSPKNEIKSLKTYFFKPKSKLKSDAFSNYGIFKEVL
ncbi:hypothetical protein EON73_05540 [bacterium]|nr:MAG: hypothetical protein EON73_05540 [bacterium]